MIYGVDKIKIFIFKLNLTLKIKVNHPPKQQVS